MKTHPSFLSATNASKSAIQRLSLIASLCCAVAGPQVLQAEYPTPGLGPLAPVNVGGMTFANYWKPSRTGMKSLLQDALVMYASAAVGKAEPHHEPSPGSLCGPLTWLMPLDEAIKTLPANHDRVVEQPMMFDCFPQSSLIVAGVHVSGSSFVDRGQQFDWIYLVVDKQRRLVGVELVALSAKTIVWRDGHPQGTQDPYYDFINMKNNAQAGRHIPYEILPAGRGVTLIHTVLPGRTRQNVNWYLAAPFARVLLDLAQHQQAGGH